MKIQILASILIVVPIFALAHVTVTPRKATAGGYAKLVFLVPHGCGGSPTTKITVQLPEGVLSVKPQVHPGWKISTKKVKLKSPVKLHGAEVTETVSEVTWKGGPLLDEYMDEFGISVKLPEKPGEKLVFPVIQDCKKGSSRWVEVATAEHAEHSRFPAPTVLLEAGSR